MSNRIYKEEKPEQKKTDPMRKKRIAAGVIALILAVAMAVGPILSAIGA